MIKTRRRPLLRAPTRDAREAIWRLWQNGGLVILGIIAVGATAFPSETLSLVRPFTLGASFVIRTALGGAAEIRDAGRVGTQAMRSLTWRARETRDLRAQVLDLQQKAVLKEEQLRELVRLRRLLQLKDDLGYPSVAARVIGGDPAAPLSTLVLDIGGHDGVREGAAVVAPAGVVGRISTVGPDHSTALWLGDPRSRIAAYVQRSRVLGVLVGTGRGCELRYLSAGDDVKVGDRVVTAGGESAFPKGILIGIVKEVRKEGILLAASIAPVVNGRRLEEVLILTRASQ
jgi:rod shape-determining protein MreC